MGDDVGVVFDSFLLNFTKTSVNRKKYIYTFYLLSGAIVEKMQENCLHTLSGYSPNPFSGFPVFLAEFDERNTENSILVK